MFIDLSKFQASEAPKEAPREPSAVRYAKIGLVIFFSIATAIFAFVAILLMGGWRFVPALKLFSALVFIDMLAVSVSIAVWTYGYSLIRPLWLDWLATEKKREVERIEERVTVEASGSNMLELSTQRLIIAHFDRGEKITRREGSTKYGVTPGDYQRIHLALKSAGLMHANGWDEKALTAQLVELTGLHSEYTQALKDMIPELNTGELVKLLRLAVAVHMASKVYFLEEGKAARVFKLGGNYEYINFPEYEK